MVEVADVINKALLLAIAGVFTILWYLLRQKDAQQQARIDLLFQKHDADVTALVEFKLQVAKEYYPKPELDHELERLEAALREGLGEVSKKMDNILSTLAQRGP